MSTTSDPSDLSETQSSNTDLELTDKKQRKEKKQRKDKSQKKDKKQRKKKKLQTSSSDEMSKQESKSSSVSDSHSTPTNATSLSIASEEDDTLQPPSKSRNKKIKKKMRDLSKKKLGFKNQFIALFLKNLYLQKRAKKTNLIIYAFTIIFIVYVFGVGEIVHRYLEETIPENKNPESYESDIFLNANFPYVDTPTGSPDKFEGELSAMSQNLTFYVTRDYEPYDQFQPILTLYDTKDSLDDQFFQSYEKNLQEIAGGIYFEHLDLSPDSPKVEYSVYFNSTDTTNMIIQMYKQSQLEGLTMYMPTLVNTANRNIFKKLWGDDPSKSGDAADLFVGLKDFPEFKRKEALDIMSIEQPFSFNFILHMLFPVFMVSIVYEKENLLIDLMKMMGLKTRIYWLVNWLFDWALYFVQVTVFYIMLVILRFRFITQNDFSIHFVLLLLWGNTMISMAFFLSNFFKKVKSTYIIGIFLVVFLTFVLPTYYWSIAGNNSTPYTIIFLLKCVPSIAFVQALMAISDASAIGQPGAKIDETSLDIKNTGSSYLFLFVQSIIFYTLTAYFNGFFDPVLNKIKHFIKKKFLKKILHHTQTIDQDEEDEVPQDVLDEIKRVKNCDDEVRILGLGKSYPGKDGNLPKHALKGLHLGIPKGQIFALLGPNGAGKTTTMSILSGLISPTFGKAYINDLKLNRHNMDKIHQIISICPQYDCLWGEQSGWETLEFFARLHGYQGEILKKRVTQTLQDLDLFEDRKKLINEYSGGMKRRISLAISLIVDSKIVFLDEPTTGMDPSSKRKVWDVIQEKKADRAIILTTHSMEEADALADRIGILENGKLRAIGVSEELKKRFGKGYKFSIHTNSTKNDKRAHKYFMKKYPNAQLLNSLACTRNYEIPKDDILLSTVFNQFESRKEKLGILDWGISHTTLEEVFLRITVNNEIGDF
ncbi:atp-binding cassette transporter subfamily a abca [Anaeramoeba flamelloides]|uniref:Atp-binding cassette transporter subfamily a abca n=1 Tax=Anaeramoeba flamelloides TaxID=1746091 RepID=A0AAV7Z7A5_9EUKA|nr:atp-binding cassette transporter subfamily a abca [Anaeramoeba flamelloides]